MIQDSSLTKAVAGIPQRSEKQSDIQKLVGAFVDVGILPQVDSVNSQIIYGRRGTGKTHILRVLEAELRGRPRVAVIYIDARTLGSTGQFGDSSIPLPARCTALFRDILGEVYNGLLSFIVDSAPEGAEKALEELDALGRASTEPFSSVSPQSIEEKRSERDLNKSGFRAGLDKGSMAVEAHADGETSSESQTATNFRVESTDKIVFPAISSTIKQINTVCGSVLFLLIDEWSSLPMDVQPYLAEFLRRSFLPLPDVAVKIASLEYRSDFSINSPKGVIGFEMGADISAFLDIDDYYVYDRNPEGITDAFADMLVKHLNNELPEGYLEQLGVKTGPDFASKVFTERKVFQELVRASEGVARDLINIFSKAYFVAHRKGKDKIERNAVLEAARQWFEQDKERNLDDELRSVLRRITDEVIGKRRARSFLLSRELAAHPIIHRLFDLRVLHLVQRGYADKDRPGVRYNIYTLDYGTYVDLMNTSRKPELGFECTDKDEQEYIVPFDDKRSIRRIILTADILNAPDERQRTLFQTPELPDKGHPE
jgi:hypothetical protein